jgi:hypothetical protein
VRPYLEKTLQRKRAGGVAEGVGPELKPQYCKKQTEKDPLVCFLLGGNHLPSLTGMRVGAYSSHGLHQVFLFSAHSSLESVDPVFVISKPF